MIKLTTIENYQDQAKRTMNDLGSNSVNGAHMALGITTEILEMEEGISNNDRVNTREEHGDINFYIANECSIYGLNFEDILLEAKTNSLMRKYEPFKLENIVDLHKRELAYAKKMDVNKLKVELVSLLTYLLHVSSGHDFSYEDSLHRNINKLYKRYPDKFTEEKALNRDLKAEYKTLK
jgi:NTP pyrophosphatase (non-canonical NTP hydrolase)